MKKVIRLVSIIAVIVFMCLLLKYPANAATGAKNGLLLSGSIIIPTMFPFAVATLYAVKMNIFTYLKPIEKALKIFGLSAEMFFVMILSFVGGYPLGSGLINELYNQKRIDKTQAHYMLCFCVNAGPAFIISAVGTLVLNSKKIGLVLFFSHILSSIVIMFFCSYRLRSIKIRTTEYEAFKKEKNAFSDSVISAAESMLKICAFVVLFSVTNSIISLFPFNDIIKSILLSLEVTNAVVRVKNIYLIAFYLGFSGINVWFQVFSMTKDCGVNLKLFVFSRFLHGALNCMIFNAIVHIFKIRVSAISNNVEIVFPQEFGFTEISVSLIVLVLLFVICLENKNKGRKLSEDLI